MTVMIRCIHALRFLHRQNEHLHTSNKLLPLVEKYYAVRIIRIHYVIFSNTLK